MTHHEHAVPLSVLSALEAAQAIKQSWQARRGNGAAALLTFVAYAPSVALGIVVGAGVGLVLYLLPPLRRRRSARIPPG